jgi:hypothetical protein
MIFSWFRIGAALAVVAVLAGIYVKGRSDGRSALQAKLTADRIKIIQDGQEITNEIINSNDDALCGILGGCADGVPNEAVSN